jgi:hypothetical protein
MREASPSRDNVKAKAKSAILQASSIDAFEENVIVIFRKELSQSLQTVLDVCQLRAPDAASSPLVSTTIISYDAEALQDCLSSINWLDLCRHYDKAQGRKSGSEESACIATATTPLEEVLAALQNPCAWPLACVQALFQTLIETLCQHRALQTTLSDRLQWLASQQCMLHTLTTLSANMPGARRLPAAILVTTAAAAASIPRTSYNRSNSSISSSIHCLHALVSLAKYFVKEFPCDYLRYLHCFLEIMGHLDGMELELDPPARRYRQQQRQQREKGPDNKERRTVRKSSTCASVDLLHGNASDNEEGCPPLPLTASMARRYQGPRTQPKPSIKDIIMTNIDGDGGGHGDPLGSKPVERLRLRSKCIKSFLSTFQKTTTGGGIVFLRLVLQSLPSHLINSPLVRLCALLLADQSSSTSSNNNTNNNKTDTCGYSCLWLFYWSRSSSADGACDKTSSFLVAYAELLVECSHFDSSERCFQAVAPLFDRLRQYCAEESDDVRETARPYLRCLAYILSRRGKVLAQHGYVDSLLAQLSIAFDRPCDWIGPGLSPDERYKTIQTLQMLGILGICDDVESVAYKPAAVVDGLSPDNVVFPPCVSIRSAAKQIPAVPCSLFSTLSLLNKAPPAPKADVPCAPPIMQCINEDVLHHVFSFLGYKRIVRMRHVSKEWKEVADSKQLWHSVYQSRYGLLPEDPVGQNETAPWKTHFVNKWLAEREIGFQRNKSGWKVRLCGYVTCMHIVKNKQQEQRHHATHQTKKRSSKKKPNQGAKKPRRLPAKLKSEGHADANIDGVKLE